MTSELYRALFSEAPLHPRIERDAPSEVRFLERARASGFWLKKAFIPGLQSPSLVSSQTGQITKLLFTFPNWALAYADLVGPYRSVISALRPGTEFVVVCIEGDCAEILGWFTAAGHKVEAVTFALMPDHVHFLDWAEDAYVSLTDASDDTHYLMEPWRFPRAGDALIADQVEEYSDSRASQAPLIFQGGNVLVADDHWFLGRDYFADSINLVNERGSPAPPPQGEDPENFVRMLFKKHVEGRRELVVIGPAKAIGLREYYGRKEGGDFILDSAAGGTGPYQPIFHIDMFLSLAGRGAGGAQRILVGDPSVAEKLLGLRMPYALHAVYDGIAADLVSRGFEVVRNPLVHWPTFDPKTTTLASLRALERKPGGNVLTAAIQELVSVGAKEDSTVRVRDWHHITWNNCLVEQSSAVGDHVYLPTFGHGPYASLKPLDTHMQDLWKGIGFTPHMLGDFNPFAERMGVVHCIKKYLGRGG